MKFLDLADWASIMIGVFGFISWNFNVLFCGYISFILNLKLHCFEFVNYK